jgi:hypothetical protein
LTWQASASDVTATRAVQCLRERAAPYLRDPANDTEWIGGIRSARLLTPGPVAVGSQVERVATFLGRRVHYVNEITELSADRLAMRSVRSPFPMRVTYAHRAASGGPTEVSVRVEGDAGRFYALAAPLLGPAVRRSVTRDLRNLKRVLEARSTRRRMAPGTWPYSRSRCRCSAAWTARDRHGQGWLTRRR